MRDELTRQGYPGAEVPVVRVSAFHALYGDPQWRASTLELMDAVDAYLPGPGSGPVNDAVADGPLVAAGASTGCPSRRGRP